VIIDKAFTEKFEGPEPSPFHLNVPTSDGFLTLMDTKSGGYVKFSFATPEREFLENLHLVNLDLEPGPAEKRLTTLEGLMAGPAFKAAVKGFENPVQLGIRRIAIGPLTAVEVVGSYRDPKAGPMYLRIVGLAHPEQARGTFVVINIQAQRTPLKTAGDFAGTLSGRALASFRYR